MRFSLTLNLFWNKQESQLISNLLGAISVGTGIAGLSSAEVPGVNLLLGVTSIATGSLSMVFSNSGNNGVKISLFLGFIPTYIGGY
ncbi:MAG: hypothetical protein HDR31_00305 [Mycoplasma sp.]|nr:hypothetical protein [Mycoplasma sp.]